MAMSSIISRFALLRVVAASLKTPTRDLPRRRHGMQIGRAEAAPFLLDQLDTHRYLRAAPMISS